MIGKRKRPRARDILRDVRRCPGHYVDSKGKARPCTKQAGHSGSCG